MVLVRQETFEDAAAESKTGAETFAMRPGLSDTAYAALLVDAAIVFSVAKASQREGLRPVISERMAGRLEQTATPVAHPAVLDAVVVVVMNNVVTARGFAHAASVLRV